MSLFWKIAHPSNACHTHTHVLTQIQTYTIITIHHVTYIRHSGDRSHSRCYTHTHSHTYTDIYIHTHSHIHTHIRTSSTSRIEVIAGAAHSRGTCKVVPSLAAKACLRGTCLAQGGEGRAQLHLTGRAGSVRGGACVCMCVCVWLCVWVYICVCMYMFVRVW